MMASYLPSPVRVTPSNQKEVSGTPLNTIRKLTMASSDTETFFKLICLKNDIIDEYLVGFFGTPMLLHEYLIRGDVDYCQT